MQGSSPPGKPAPAPDPRGGAVDADAQLGRLIAGKYRLCGVLGRGGMGTVFDAEHVELGVKVAIKLMHPSVASMAESTRQFRCEARAASRISHPNVVRVFDAGCSGDDLYIVMERLRGKSLRSWLRNRTGLPSLQRVGSIMQQVFAALDAAHSQGVLHRDVKPENVFLALDDSGEEVVKVVDFGLAQYPEREGSGGRSMNADVLWGTPAYMSPEQCMSLPVTESSDLYSAGCMLTELLQGHPPFCGATKVDVLAMHAFSVPSPLMRAGTAEVLPKALELLRLSLLAKRPQDRPRDATEARVWLLHALAELERTLARESVRELVPKSGVLSRSIRRSEPPPRMRNSASARVRVAR